MATQAADEAEDGTGERGDHLLGTGEGRTVADGERGLDRLGAEGDPGYGVGGLVQQDRHAGGNEEGERRVRQQHSPCGHGPERSVSPENESPQAVRRASR
jgi:hypothetical protein